MACSSSASLPPRGASSSSLALPSLGADAPAHPPPALPSLAADDLARSAAPLASAWTLPPAAYTDPSVWDREVDSIFRSDWICVARSSQIPAPGDYVAVELIDQPVLVIRDDDESIHAMSNVCLHRSMPLVSGTGSARWVVCPYHRWSYARDGSLHTAPMMEGAEDFDIDHCRLPPLAVEEWQGFVFVSMRDDPAPLASQLETLAATLEQYGLGDMVIADTVEFDSPWNWKLLVENFMEAYHHIGPHRDTFQQSNPAKDSYVVDNEGGPWSLLHMPGVTDLDESPDLPFLSGLDRDRRADLLAVCVYPTLLFAVTGTLATWYEMVPRAHDRMTLRIHLLLEPAVAADPDVIAALPEIREGLTWIHGEDIPVNEGPWRGLHAPLAAQGRLSPYEAAIWQFNQYWSARLTS
jgi:phenylpropionate dioxygenase-like ring-hydroxylating dioxygenase large terminal subunit